MGRLGWRTSCWLMAVILAPCAAAQADIVEMFTFTDVESVSLAGSAGNDLRMATSTTPDAYTLGMLAWAGAASPQPDPLDPTVFPSWGADLAVRVTHVRSGTQTDVRLGRGAEFGPGPQAFSGATRALNGLEVLPGDQFLFEFFEEFDDPIVSPDAVWSTIALALSDDFAASLAPPGEGIVRFETRGENTFPTGAGQAGAEFFRIRYGGPGAGPAIAQVVLNTHAESSDGVWFDSDEAGESPETEGTFQAHLLDGVSEPLVTFELEDPDPAFAGDFAVLRLSFAPGDFTPGKGIHFGIDTDGGFSGPATGDAFARLDPPLTLTLVLEDGTLATGALTQVRQDVDHAAWLDLDLRERKLQADTDADGDVDGHDLLHMLLQFGRSRLAMHHHGDTDGNGTVDRADVAVWRAQVGRTLPSDVLRLEAAIPEPSAACLAAVLIGYWMARRLILSAASRKRRLDERSVAKGAD